jgi:hypothetical protein
LVEKAIRGFPNNKMCCNSDAIALESLAVGHIIKKHDDCEDTNGFP